MKSNNDIGNSGRPRSRYAWRLLGSALVWIQHRLARRNLTRGFPQLAMFAFDHVGIRINAYGRYENDELEALLAMLARLGRLRGACLDVGANIGNHSLFFSSWFEEVHAFEPAPATFSLLSYNAGLVSNVHCHNVGASDSTREAYWSAPAHNVGEGSVASAVPASDGRRVEVVRLVDLDSFAAIEGLDIGLIKIDVEGHEAAVLDGAKAILSRMSPIIVFEQHASEISAGTSPVIERLRAFGYQDFYSFRRFPSTKYSVINVALRLLMGERHSFVRVDRFDSVFHSMIVAIK